VKVGKQKTLTVFFFNIINPKTKKFIIQLKNDWFCCKIKGMKTNLKRVYKRFSVKEFHGKTKFGRYPENAINLYGRPCGKIEVYHITISIVYCSQFFLYENY
jgi:hypothetical protein